MKWNAVTSKVLRLVHCSILDLANNVDLGGRAHSCGAKRRGRDGMVPEVGVNRLVCTAQVYGDALY